MNNDNRDRPHQEPRNDDDSMERARKDLAEGKYVGKGMTSPDSTQVPLSAETGEPDERAIRGDRQGKAHDRHEASAPDESGQKGTDRR